MARILRCKHCGRLFKANPRIKNGQQYCRLPLCQAARKNAWRRAKNHRDEVYRKKRHDSNKRWRKDHKAHRYQQRYRETHLEYVVSNREQQQGRNNKRIKKIVKTDVLPQEKPINAGICSFLPGNKDRVSEIVKSDSLPSERLITPGLYSLSPCQANSDGKIVKSDSFMVQLTILQQNTACLLQKNT